MTLPRYTESEFLEHAMRLASPEELRHIAARRLIPRACSCSYAACRGWQLDWASLQDQEDYLRSKGLILPPERSPVTAG